MHFALPLAGIWKRKCRLIAGGSTVSALSYVFLFPIQAFNNQTGFVFLMNLLLYSSAGRRCRPPCRRRRLSPDSDYSASATRAYPLAGLGAPISPQASGAFLARNACLKSWYVCVAYSIYACFAVCCSIFVLVESNRTICTLTLAS
jgi:hypothetical protein